MIRIENVWTGGFEGALRGMRNPYESQERSDSGWCSAYDCRKCRFNGNDGERFFCLYPYSEEEFPTMSSGGQHYVIGPADMALAEKLIKAGPEHRKFLRMIHVQADVVAPRYWWQEASCYKWLSMNSSSTMHLIGKRRLALEDFSCDGSMKNMIHMKYAIENINTWIEYYLAWDTMNAILKNILEKDGIFNKTDLVRFIKQLLPESYNQLRTIDTNYEALLSIHHQRKNHRLSEWREFCTWIESLPYMGEFLEVKNAD